MDSAGSAVAPVRELSEGQRRRGLPLRLPWSPWVVGVVSVALLLALPVLVIAGFVLQPPGEAWSHLAETVLEDYVVNSLVLMIGVTVGTLALGVTAAWLTTTFDFPGRRHFEWALLLPMAIPAYIIAYTYTGMLDFAGPVQSALRGWFGWGYGDYWFPEIRSRGGAVAMLTLVLYPYVYLLTRAAFLGQSASMLEASRTLGNSGWHTFFRVQLPLARPAIVAGVSLALMETLADYGTVQYFGVSTFTTGIFRTWYGLDDSAAAAQLAAMLLGFVLVLLTLERGARRRARFHHTTHRQAPPPRQPLSRGAGLGAFGFCLLILTLGFLLPGGQLLIWAVQTAGDAIDTDFLRLFLNSLSLAGITSALALGLALFLAYGHRLKPSRVVGAAVRVAGLGYAVPGAVIAVGVLIPFAWFDHALDGWMARHLGISTGLLLSGTLAALIFAYLTRFLPVALQTVEAGLGKIRPSMDDAARSLGLAPHKVPWRVHIPILRGSLLTAVLLVFVDVLKELPATLVLRPFDFNTLALRAFELASDERLAESSTAALAIVLAGIIPVVLLSRSISRSHNHADASA